MTGLLSPVHIALLALVLLVVFGGRHLPQLGRLTGTAIRTRVLGRPPAAPPTPLPVAPPTPPSRGLARRDAAALTTSQRSLRRRMTLALLRRVPGPVGWVARLLTR